MHFDNVSAWKKENKKFAGLIYIKNFECVLVRWCRMQASSHNSQGFVDGGVNKAGMSTATPNRSAVLCSRMDQS